jgi:hypothetical protein
MVAIALAIILFQGSSPDRVIGLLSLPEVFGGRMCAPFKPSDVSLHTTPDDGTKFATVHVDQEWSFAPHGGCEGLKVSVHRGEQREALPTLEYDYEMPAAIVVEQRNGWFRVRVQQGTAWIKASVSDRFMPLNELFEEFIGVTAIDKGFTGRLMPAPGGNASGGSAGDSAAMRVLPAQPVQVLEMRESGGQTFVKVEVMSHSLCNAGANGPPEIVATGWLPLHSESGEPTIWYSSRGC